MSYTPKFCGILTAQLGLCLWAANLSSWWGCCGNAVKVGQYDSNLVSHWTSAQNHVQPDKQVSFEQSGCILGSIVDVLWDNAQQRNLKGITLGKFTPLSYINQSIPKQHLNIIFGSIMHLISFSYAHTPSLRSSNNISDAVLSNWRDGLWSPSILTLPEF